MKKLFFFILAIYFATFSSFSQEADITEKIKFLIKNKPFDIEVIDSVLKKNRKIKEHVELLVKESEKASYLQGQYYGYNAIGIIYRDVFLFDKSISEYKKALEITKKIKDSALEVKILNSLGSVYRRQDDVRNALNYHQEALSKALEIKNPSISVKKSLSVSENSLGNIYISLKQYKLALKQFKKSITTQRELDNELGLAINYQNIGEANEELGNIEKALKNYQKSLFYNNRINSKIGKIICGYSIANLLIKQKKFNQALITVDTVLQLAIKQKDMYCLSSTYNILGKVQAYLNRFKPAELNLEKALKIASDFKIQNVVVKANENLALLNEKKKDYKKAYIYYKKAKEEEAKTFNNRNLLYVSDLTNKYDAERKNNEIKHLAKQNEITQLQLDRNNNITAFILGVFLLIGIILYTIYRNRSLRVEKRFLTLKQQVLQSQMNPHFIFNALNSIKLYIINNEQKNAVRYLNKFAKLIRKILEASQLKEVSLYDELDTMELYMSIENIRFNNEIDYRFNIDPSINVKSIKIPPLILQPFLENSLWHGLSSKKNDKKIILSVNKINTDFIEIVIEDNGIGRKASAKIKANKKIKRKSISIDLTKERLRSFGREFEKDFSLRYYDIKGEDNTVRGTKASIRIPLVLKLKF